MTTSGGVHGPVGGADDLVLRRQRGEAGVEGLVHRGVPALLLGGDLLLEVGADPVAAEGLVELDQRLAGVGDDRQGGAVLVRVDRCHVDVDELQVRVLERGPGRGGEVLVAGADADDQVRFGCQGVGRRRARGADGAEGVLVVPRQDADAGLRVAHRDAGQFGEPGQFLVGVRVQDAAAGDDQRPLGGPDGFGGAGDVVVVRFRAADPPLTLGEEFLGHVEGLGLDVLGQRDGHRSGLGRVGEDPQAVVERGEQLLRAGDTVEELGQRPERVVDREVVGVGLFELLQHRVRGTRGERVGRQQQHRQPVRGGQRRTGEQVRRTRADGGADREGLPAAGVPGVADGLVGLGLLVAALVVRHDARIELLVLLQGLAHTGHVAVPENAESARDQAFAEIDPTHGINGVLLGKVFDHGLRHGHPAGSSCCSRLHGRLLRYFCGVVEE
jgi:hypothetical protein